LFAFPECPGVNVTEAHRITIIAIITIITIVTIFTKIALWA